MILAGRCSRDPEAWHKRIDLAEAICARVMTDRKAGAAFPTYHPMHAAGPATSLSPEGIELVAAADVILSLDWIDLAGTLKTACRGRAPAGKVIQVSVDQYVHNGWSMDYQGLPPADVLLPVTPEEAVPDLLEAVGGGKPKPIAVKKAEIPPLSTDKLIVNDLVRALKTATGDRDAFQLASASTTILQPIKAGEMARIGPAEVVERYGVEPSQVPDFIALRGDPSDKIPGATGVGPKSAASTLRKFGSLEEALAAGRFVSQADDLRLYRKHGVTGVFMQGTFAPCGSDAELRAMTEKSMEQARVAFNTFMSAAQQAVSHFEGQAKAMQASAKDVSEQAMGYAERNVANAFAFADRLVRAKDIQQVIALQTEFVQAQMKELAEQAKVLSESASKMAMKSVQPKS